MRIRVSTALVAATAALMIAAPAAAQGGQTPQQQLKDTEESIAWYELWRAQAQRGDLFLVQWNDGSETQGIAVPVKRDDYVSALYLALVAGEITHEQMMARMIVDARKSREAIARLDILYQAAVQRRDGLRRQIAAQQQRSIQPRQPLPVNTPTIGARPGPQPLPGARPARNAPSDNVTFSNRPLKMRPDEPSQPDRFGLPAGIANRVVGRSELRSEECWTARPNGSADQPNCTMIELSIWVYKLDDGSDYWDRREYDAKRAEMQRSGYYFAFSRSLSPKQ